MNKFSEDDVHKHLHATGLEAVIVDCPLFDVDEVEPCAEEPDFQLWRIIKSRALAKLERLHGTIRYGTFVGTKIKLPTDHTKPMELDLLGTHEDGLFVLELKSTDLQNAMRSPSCSLTAITLPVFSLYQDTKTSPMSWSQISTTR